MNSHRLQNDWESWTRHAQALLEFIPSNLSEVTLQYLAQCLARGSTSDMMGEGIDGYINEY